MPARNPPPGVTVTFVADRDGHYIFDFVDPGVYTITGELQGFKTAQQRNVRVPQRGSVTADLTLEVGGLEERVDGTGREVQIGVRFIF